MLIRFNSGVLRAQEPLGYGSQSRAQIGCLWTAPGSGAAVELRSAENRRSQTGLLSLPPQKLDCPHTHIPAWKCHGRGWFIIKNSAFNSGVIRNDSIFADSGANQENHS